MGSAENFTDPEKELGSDVPPHVWDMIHEFLLGIKDPKLDLREAHLRPAVANIYVFIVFMYAIIILTGLVFNLAVCGHILWNKLYNDATYSFIINNAISDVVKCVVVLPISLYVLMVQNWMLGELLCSFLPMLQYNNNRTIGRPVDLSQICNMKLMDAQRTIENKDVLIKMLQDQLKKIEEMYKRNLTETEQMRYKYCVAANQLNQIKNQQESVQKMPCSCGQKDEVGIGALREEMLKWMKQQNTNTTDLIGIKEKLDELGKMIMGKQEQLSDKIEKIVEERYTKITHETVTPETANQKVIRGGRVAKSCLGSYRQAAIEVDAEEAQNVDEIVTVEDVRRDDLDIIENELNDQIEMDREEFYEEDEQTREIVEPRDCHRNYRDSIDNRELFRRALENKRLSSNLYDRQHSLNQYERRSSSNQYGRQSSSNQCDRISSSSNGLKKRSVIFLGIPNDISSPDLSPRNLSPPHTSSEDVAELDGLDFIQLVTEFGKLRDEFHQIKSIVQKLEDTNQNYETEIGKLSHTISSTNQSTLFKLEESKTLARDLIKDNLYVHSELEQVKKTVDKLRTIGGSRQIEIPKDETAAALSSITSFESETTIDKVLCQIKSLTEEDSSQLTRENPSSNTSNIALVSSSHFGVTAAFPRDSQESLISIQILHQIKQIRQRNEEYQRAGNVKQSAEEKIDELDEQLDEELCNELRKELEQKLDEKLDEGIRLDLNEQPGEQNLHAEEQEVEETDWRRGRRLTSVSQRKLNLDFENDSSADSLRNMECKNVYSHTSKLTDAFISGANSDDSSSTSQNSLTNDPHKLKESKSQPSLSYEQMDNWPSYHKNSTNSNLLSTSEPALDFDQDNFPKNRTTTRDEQYLQYYIEKVIEENGKLKTTINDLLENVKVKIDELNKDKVNAQSQYPSTENCKCDKEIQIRERDVEEQIELTPEDPGEHETVVIGDNQMTLYRRSKCTICLFEQQLEWVEGPVTERFCDNCDVVIGKFSVEDADDDGEKQKLVLNTLENYILYLQKQLLLTKKIENDVQNLKEVVTNNNEAFRKSFTRYKHEL